MSGLYLTPASLSYLTGCILSLALTGHGCYRLRAPENRTAQTALPVGFFAFITLYIGFLFWDAALASRAHLAAAYLERVALAGAMIFLLQFTYRFPEARPRYKNEARLLLFASVSYFLVESVFAVYRFADLNDGLAVYRPGALDYIPAFAFLFAMLVFLRQAAYSLPPHSSLIAVARTLWDVQEPAVGAVRALALTCIVPFVTVLTASLCMRFTTSLAARHLILSVGILAALFVVLVFYFNFQPEQTSFRLKIVGTALAVSLGTFGLTGWLVAPAHDSAFEAKLPNRQAFRFVPNTKGAYDVIAIPFHFDEDWGARLDIREADDGSGSAALDFVFPFYGNPYYKIFVSDDGIIGIGQSVRYRDVENDYWMSPAILPLYFDMKSAPGGVYARKDADALLLTWDTRSAYSPEDKFNFQARLYSNGVFEITYNDLPAHIYYAPDESPDASVWLIGVARGDPESAPEVFPPASWTGGNAQGFLQDYYLAFRQYQHRILVLPLYLLVVNIVIILLGLQFLIFSNTLRPLQRLLAAIRQVEAGDLNVDLPVKYRDELGQISGSFNDIVAQLRLYTGKFEERVTERTIELEAANSLLRSELKEHKASEVRVTQQQSKLAAAEEREQMVRDLQDSFGQVIGYINVQAQAVQTLLNKNQTEAAHENLHLLAQAAQDAHAGLRSYILGLRDAEAHQHNFYESLRTYLTAFGRAWDIETVFSMPQDTLPFLPETMEDQLLHIVQEALVNIRKHANARRVEVLMTFSPSEIVLIVSDNGRGFDLKSIWNIDHKHLGLRIIRERAEQIGGRLELRSHPGHGTQVVAHIPRIFAPAHNERTPKELLNLRILLVDDQPLFLEGMRNLLTSRGLTVIGVARDGLQALDKVRTLHPDVVLMDVYMPLCNGVEATRLIKKEFPDVKVALLVASESDSQIVEAIKYGVSGYFIKGMDVNELFTLLSRMLRDEMSIPPVLVSRLMAEIPHSEAVPVLSGQPNNAELTDRQWEILQLVAKGLTYKEAAKLLHISEVTIKYHMGQILERLHLKNREQAVSYAQRLLSRQ